MWTIYLKELLELARDRKTFFFTVFVPVFAMPLIFAGFGYLSSTMFKSASQAEMSYSIFGKEHAPLLARRFAAEKGFHEVALAAPGDIKAAIVSFRKAVQANASYGAAWRALGLANEKLGEWGQAKTAFQKYLQVAPNAQDAAQIRDRIKGL